MPASVIQALGTAVAIFLSSGPVVYAGLLMLIDPAKIIEFIDRFVNRVFKLHQNIGEYEDLADPKPVNNTASMRVAIRLAGAALAIVGAMRLFETLPV